MSVLQAIEDKVAAGINCDHLEVVNESNMHNVPAGSESHFKVIVVSGTFQGQLLVKRHRQINKLLSDEFEQGLHALSIHAYTLDEWQKKNGDSPLSPPCKGGSTH